MGQYVLLFRHSDPRQEDLDRIANAPGVTILDQTVNRAMLLDASEEAVAALEGQLQDWTVAEAVTYPRPGPAAHHLSDGLD